MSVKMALLVLSAVVMAVAASNVHVLNDNNFDKMLSEHSPMLVEFYAPWCGHCKALEPEYEEAAKTLADKKAKVHLGKVDATSEDCAQLQKRFKIQGFPTLKYFASPASQVEYDGERKAKNIVSWLEKKTGPAYVTLASEEAIKTMKASVDADSEKIIVVGVFAAKEQATAFEAAARKDFSRDFYAVMNDAKLAAALDAKATIPFVQVLRSFNISNPALTVNPLTIGDQGSLEKFIAASSEPDSDVVAYNNDDILKTIKQGVHVVEFYAPWCGYCKQFVPEYEKVAQHYLTANKKIVIAKFDGTTSDEITEQEGIESFPTIKVYKNGEAAVYKGDLSKEAVIKFIDEKLVAKAEDFADKGTAEASLKDSTGILACVTADHDSLIDLAAFQSASATFKVVRVRCPQGSESASLYVDGKITSTFEGSSIADFQSFRKWYKRAAVPRVFQFDDALFEEIMAAEYKQLVFFFNTNVNENDDEIQHFHSLAKSGKFPDAAFAFASASEDYLLQFFHLKADQLPSVRVLDLADNMSTYVGSVPVTVESLTKMLEDHAQGKLEKVVPPADEEDQDLDDEEYSPEEEGTAEGSDADDSDEQAELDEEQVEDEEDEEQDEL